MPKTLVIDTASPACSVALFDDDQLIDSCYAHLGRGHAERLVPMIDALPQKGRADAVYVNVGPGSFTGIRVGISAARALALAWDLQCRGYSCMAMIAAMANSNGPVDVAMQGGHGEFFVQSFDGNTRPTSEILSLTPDDAASASKAPFIAGSAALQLAELRPDVQALDILPDARQWMILKNTEPLPPSAVYIRGPDAKLPETKNG